MKPNVHLDLVLFDFADRYELHPREALHALQALLLSEDDCRARIAFLEGLTEARHSQLTRSSETEADFAGEIRVLVEMGAFQAIQQGRMSAERLAALSRHPDALWRAHQALMAEPQAQPDEISRTAPESGFTRLARLGAWGELSERLNRYLPEVLSTVGLPETLADRLLKFLLERAKQGTFGRRRFREMVPGWLEEFAAAEGYGNLPQPLTEEAWVSIIERTALRLVLVPEPPGEPAWAREFRQTALRRVGSWNELVRLPVPDTSPWIAELSALRRDMIAQFQHERELGCTFWELN